MTTAFTNYSATFSGSWTQSDVDSMQVYLLRTVQGGGSPSGRDDDVQISNVYASLTYVQSVTFDQSSYRWFDNADNTASQDFVVALGSGGADRSKSVVQTSDGGYAVTGYTNSYGAGTFDMYITKYDNTGIMSLVPHMGLAPVKILLVLPRPNLRRRLCSHWLYRFLRRWWQ